MKTTFGFFVGMLVLAYSQTFEVASLKLHPEPVTISSDASVSGARVMATGITLLDFITSAYGVRYELVSGGPKWAYSDHYDLAARAPGERKVTKAELAKMLQALLADRFHLEIRRETKEVAAYALVVDKSGHKLRETAAGAPGKNFVNAGAGGMHMELSSGTMEALARQLSNTAGRPVVDRTGLTAHYAFKLDWLPADTASGPDSDVPNMFTAVREQLGLKLETAKANVEMIVIDRAEKPTEN